MNVTITQKNLAAGIVAVIRAVASSTTVPALNGILLEVRAGESVLHLKASDNIIVIEKKVEVGGHVTEGASGGIILPAKHLSDIVKKMPAGNVVIDVNEENWTAKITWTRGEFILHGLAPTEFPQLDLGDNVAEASWLKIPQATLKSLINSTTFAASRLDSRPVLTGALVEERSEGLRMVCIDGVRLAMRTAAMQIAATTSDLRRAIIPAKSLDELSRLLGDKDDCRLALGENYAYCDMGGVRFSSRLLEGQFPPYAQIIPSKFAHTMHVDSAALSMACTRAALLSGDDDHTVKLKCEDGALVVTSSTPEVGNMREEIDCKLEGDSFEVGFNARFLSEGLEEINGPALLQANGAYGAVLVKAKGNDDFVYIAMPLRTLGE